MRHLLDFGEIFEKFSSFDDGDCLFVGYHEVTSGRNEAKRFDRFRKLNLAHEYFLGSPDFYEVG